MADRNEGKRVYLYQGTLPGWIALILVVPVLLFFVSMLLALLVGGALAAICLPLLVRRQLRRAARDSHTIELDRTQYSRVERPAGRLPEE